MPESPADTNTAQTGGQAAKPGETALDQLLSQWDQQQGNGTDAAGKAPDTVSGTTALQALKPVVEFAQREMSERQTKQVNDDMQAAVEFISEPDDLKGLKGNVAIGMLEAFAREDPSFVKAFEQRQTNPSEWKAGLEKARDWVKDAVTDFKGGGTESVRSDVEAAKAAVQGQTTQAAETEGPNPVELFNMSDQDFEEVLQKERAKVAHR